ncbi:protein PHOX1-like [Nicotiana tomentosiformis]|uniref:protein PHOX1-like n=1 Tax=Nicotiana tomentosiformis TaxID=4098 RepID=UPI00051C8271|nr:protein PHOX1-like [Nicotiana tomentosiformis]
MGKDWKKSKKLGGKSGDTSMKQNKVGENNSPRRFDKDTAVFIAMSHELKDEGNKLFQKRDYEGAMLKYDKAIKLLPRNHIDVSYLRSNIAACYMQMGLSEYPRAIHECNLALEVTPKYSKALMKRARCYEALNRLDLAQRDVNRVLEMEPNNLMAIEIAERVKTTIEQKGIGANDVPIDLIPVPEYVELPFASSQSKSSKEKAQKKKSKKVEEKMVNGKAEEKGLDNQIDLKQTDNRNEKENAENKDGKVEEMKLEIRIEENKDKDQTQEEKIDDKMEGKKAENKTNRKKAKDKSKEKKSKDEIEVNKAKDRQEDNKDEDNEERKTEDKLVVEEIISRTTEEEPKRTVKLVFGEDIRWAQVPLNCSILTLREVIGDRFPNLKAVLIKYRDQEGDLVTVTTNEELRWAEASGQHGSVRLYIVEVNPEQDPFYEKIKREEDEHKYSARHNQIVENGYVEKSKENGPVCIDDWIFQFSNLFKNYVGFESDAYLDLHEVGMKLYSEALEEAVTSEEAQCLFSTAGETFQEMAALALFNWGNVHMSRARKRVYLKEDSSGESLLAQVKFAYDWAQKEYSKAEERYEEALKIKPNFYEGILALGQQQFEQAKLSWYYAISTGVDLDSWPSTEVLHLYNSAEENMERGMQMWEDAEEQRLNELSSPDKILSQQMKSENFLKGISAGEATEQAANMRSQINLLWGTMLYERSLMEFKLGLPLWHESLEVAVEKFEFAGASPTDIAVMIKNHCSNGTATEGLGFNIDEIVQAWNEMYEARRWERGVPSFRLEPLLRRRVSKLYHALELA